MSEVVYHFDMDGVLCDWVSMYNERGTIPLEVFSEFSREHREALKAELFDYDFFRDMRPIEAGVAMLKDAVASGRRVRIVSATGRVNRGQVMAAKRHWVAEHISPSIEVLFVDKVEEKHVHMVRGATNVLIDDRQIAVDAWEAKGGIGVLFVD